MPDDPTPATQLIPTELLSHVRQSDCVLFLGADLPLGYPGAPLSRPDLAAALAETYGLARDQSWPETATALLGTHDRHTLIRFLKDRLEGPQVQPGPLHQAVARAGFKAIVTTWFDECLEYALRDAGCRVHRVVTDLETLYGGQGQRDVTLVKLFGCISRPDSLVLTTREQFGLIGRLGQKLTAIISFATVRPLLFVGHDLCDGLTMALYDKASEGVVKHMQRAYAVWPGPTDAMRAHWQGIPLEFLAYQPTAFLEAVASQAPAVEPVSRPAIRVRKPPYKFLDYYEAQDADIFCGRDTESQIAYRLVLSYRLLTLFSPSGAGKTSLLLAGVLPRLAPDGYDYVYVRALDAPLTAVRKAIAARAGRTDWETGADLRAFLTASLGEKDRLVIVLDQFEELFLRVGSRDRASLFEQLAQALAQSERDVRVVFSLREDYLAQLDEARPFLPDVLSNSYRLVALDRGNARVAITEPAARAGVRVEPALADALVGRDGQGDLVEASGQVPPAALQIVMDRLYRQALPAGHAEGDPPPPGLTLSLAAYQAFRHIQGQGADARDLNGAEAILAGYVAEGLDRLPALRNEDGTPLGADPALGQAILQAMVTSKKTKAALTHDEILTALDEAEVIRHDDEADRRKVKATQLGLERVRLLRSFNRDNVSYDELAHDYLAREIAASISQAELQTRAVRELLRREVDSWQRHGLLIAPEALRLIDEQREALRKLRPVEVELVFRSALATGYEVSYWREHAPTVVGKVEQELFGGLASEDAAQAEKAVSSLAALASTEIVERLAALVDCEFDDRQLTWIDHQGKSHPVRNSVLNLRTRAQRRAMAALAKMVLPEATAALVRWTPPGMVLIPAGPFTMGSTQSSDQGPVHEVWLDAFWIDRYPVTNAQWAAFLATDPWRRRELWTEAGWKWREASRAEPDRWSELRKKLDHPVRYVCWYESLAYARWAGKVLSSEAQWEKAARSTDGRRYPWGDTFNKNKCNTSESGIGDTTPVGKYSPAGDSAYGVVDMAGNVWEWCRNLYVPYRYNAGDGREVLEGTGDRVLRGGSWFDGQDYAAAPYRYRVTPASRSLTYFFGVRVCAVLPPP